MEAKIKSIKTALPDNMQEVTLLELEEGCTAGEAFNVLMSYPKLKAFKIAGVEYKRTQVGRLSGGDRLGGAAGSGSPLNMDEIFGTMQTMRRQQDQRAENDRRRQVDAARQHLDRMADLPQQIAAARDAGILGDGAVTRAQQHIAETNPTAPRTQGIYEQYINNPYRAARQTAPEYTTAMERLMRENPAWTAMGDPIPPGNGIVQQLANAGNIADADVATLTPEALSQIFQSEIPPSAPIGGTWAHDARMIAEAQREEIRHTTDGEETPW